MILEKTEVLFCYGKYPILILMKTPIVKSVQLKAVLNQQVITSRNKTFKALSSRKLKRDKRQPKAYRYSTAHSISSILTSLSRILKVQSHHRGHLWTNLHSSQSCPLSQGLRYGVLQYLVIDSLQCILDSVPDAGRTQKSDIGAALSSSPEQVRVCHSRAKS